MINRAVASRYARALFDAALSAGKLDAVKLQFPDFVEYLKSNKEFQDFLFHPTIGEKNKRESVEKAFAKALDPMLMDFLSLVIDKNREAYLELMLEKFTALVMEHEKRAEAKIYTPYPLPGELKSRLAADLTKVFGKSIDLREIEDGSLIGGIRVMIGDTIMDGSVRSRLDQARDFLLAAKVH